MKELLIRAYSTKDKQMLNVITINLKTGGLLVDSKYKRNYKLSEVILMQGVRFGGKVIYEGDVINYYDELYKVIYVNKHLTFYVKNLKNSNDTDKLVYLAKEEIIVVGNIYENFYV